MKNPPDLPEGVAPDNHGRSLRGSPQFKAPDMATPRFVADHAASMDADRPASSSSDGEPEYASARAAAKKTIGAKESESGFSNRQNVALLLAVVALAIGVAAVFRVYNPADPIVRCQDLPSWNQHDCELN